MILNALVEYYDRLANDPKTEVPQYGFSLEWISFCLVIEADGTLHQVVDERRESDGRTRPRPMIVPDRGVRSGSGTKSNFLWDNTGYVLGRAGKGNPERSKKKFESFSNLHHELAAQFGDDDGYRAVLAFLDNWDPSQAEEQIVEWEDVCDTNLVFRLRGRHQYVHESDAVQPIWVGFLGNETDSVAGVCLTTGGSADIARLHPPIRRVHGAQSTGAGIVSFNLDAFESYGKSQSYNAPVSVEAAFRYATALNHLLADRAHRITVGDSTLVFWTEEPTGFEAFFGPALNEYAVEDEELKDRVQAFLGRLRKGNAAVDELGDANTRFFILGLSPNASRLSIRLWLESTAGELFDRLRQHVQDIEMIGLEEGSPPPSVRQLLLETARDAKDIPPLLAGAVLRSVLTGSPYPDALLQTILRRIRAEASVRHRRAAILKACLARRFRCRSEPREIPVSLKLNHSDPAYHLGRYFATLEKIQKDALGEKLNRTIRDSFFGAASTTPATVFPRLIKLSQHHLAKIENTGLRIVREKLIQEITSHLECFPNHLSLEGQGLFFIAYYHQMQDFYTPQSTASETATNAESL